jgi:hypothetical protein
MSSITMKLETPSRVRWSQAGHQRRGLGTTRIDGLEPAGQGTSIDCPDDKCQTNQPHKNLERLGISDQTWSGGVRGRILTLPSYSTDQTWLGTGHYEASSSSIAERSPSPFHLGPSPKTPCWFQKGIRPQNEQHSVARNRYYR